MKTKIGLFLIAALLLNGHQLFSQSGNASISLDVTGTHVDASIYLRGTGKITWTILGFASFAINYNTKALAPPVELTEGRWDNDSNSEYSDQVIVTYGNGGNVSVEIGLNALPSVGSVIPLDSVLVATIRFNILDSTARPNITWNSIYTAVLDNNGTDITSGITFLDPANKSVKVKLAIQGYYNANDDSMIISDTVHAHLRNPVAPYEIVDSSVAVVDNVTLEAEFVFSYHTPGEYYLVIDHRNSLETWSGKGHFYYNQLIPSNFNFTSDSISAFGNNMILKGSRYCVYSGDVTNDEVIDLTDLNLILNSTIEFVTGHDITDINGDSNTNLDDLLIAYNNSVKFVRTMTP